MGELFRIFMWVGIVFAVLMMVQKFGYSVSDMTMLLLANAVFTTLIAPRLGR